MKRKRQKKFFLFGAFLGLVVLFFLGLIWLKFNYHIIKVNPSIQTRTATESAFGKAVALAKKKAEEEAKKQEAERQFMATYGPCYWLPILMYHHIDNKAGGLYVDPTTFASQMDYLIGKGYTTTSLPEIASLLSSGQVPSKIVALTFDDGYRDFYINAYPILRQRNLKATVFLITQLMEGNDYLTWEETRELAGNPLITIGDHTLDHKILSSLPVDQIKNEITASKGIIESQINKTVNTFAYPYGGYNQTAINDLSEAGFVAAVTTQYGNQCIKLPLTLRRIRIGRVSLSSYGL